jgi:hypothetical protein
MNRNLFGSVFLEARKSKMEQYLRALLLCPNMAEGVLWKKEKRWSLQPPATSQQILIHS